MDAKFMGYNYVAYKVIRKTRSLLFSFIYYYFLILFFFLECISVHKNYTFSNTLGFYNTYKYNAYPVAIQSFFSINGNNHLFFILPGIYFFKLKSTSNE